MTSEAELLASAETGLTCAGCAAPMSGDQRYCLSCGTRRRDAPEPVVRRDPMAAPVVAAGRPQVNGVLRDNAPLGALVGLLLLALLIGILLGHWAGAPAAATAQPPQVISVGGGGAVPTTTPAAADAAAPKAATKSPSGRAAKKAPSTKKDASVKVPPKTAPKVLKNLDRLSGKEYQKQIDKLPKKISTGGKPPPKDKKAPAGGGSFQDIG